MSIWSDLSQQLIDVLVPYAEPVAITFTNEPTDLPTPNREYPTSTDDGRTGAAPAGCVFWIEGARSTFATIAQDHANCSVGSFTHGFLTLEEASQHSDVGVLLESGWVQASDFPQITHITNAPTSVIYGPLKDTTTNPDVVLIRINAKSLMVCHDAWPSLRIEGKPQCHIVAIAKESMEVAASVGCMLSRTRTGMGADELTLAIPGVRLGEFVAAISKTANIDTEVARYAIIDSERFQHQ